MRKLIKKIISLSASSIIFIPAITFGDQPSNLPPRISLWGNAGNRFLGESDSMFPIIGNSDNEILANLTAKYGSDNAWLGSAGVVNRAVVNHSILGWYLFGDYNMTYNHKSFMVLNPGVEWMTTAWDTHVNGYIPTSKRSKVLNIYTGEELGMGNTIYFSGHAQYDTLFDYTENVGSGADFEVGRTFVSTNHARLFGGGYYFTPKYSRGIKGVEGGFEMPLKYPGMTVRVWDTYDNLNHNTFALTLRLTIGGIDKTNSSDVHDRMLDIIPRHIGSLRTGDGIPSEKKMVNTGKKTVVLNNIWFFNPSLPTLLSTTQAADQGLLSCTFEHPCNGISQNKIDEIQSIARNALFYFSPGTYNNPSVGSGYNFYHGQNLYGRTADYRQLAVGNQRALLNDSLILNGNTDVYNIRVNGQSVENLSPVGSTPIEFQVGVLSRSTGENNIYNTNIQSNATDRNVLGFVNNGDASILNFYNSTVSSNLDGFVGFAIGGASLQSGGVSMNNSSISVLNTSPVFIGDSITIGFANNESAEINLTNSTITLGANLTGIAAGIINNSSDSTGLGVVNLTNSKIEINAFDSGTIAAIFNQGNNVSGIAGTVNITDSLLTVSSFNNQQTVGIFNSGSGVTNVSNTTVLASGDANSVVGVFNQGISSQGRTAEVNLNQSFIVALSGGAGQTVGIYTNDSSMANVTNSLIRASGNTGNVVDLFVGTSDATATLQDSGFVVQVSGTATGANIVNSGTVNDNGGNQCSQNGTLVPC